jgi:hypothetical protein
MIIDVIAHQAAKEAIDDSSIIRSKPFKPSKAWVFSIIHAYSNGL